MELYDLTKTADMTRLILGVALGGSCPVSRKEYVSGRRRRPARGRDGIRAALYLRVSTAGQRSDLQHDGLSAYATRAGLEIIETYGDVAVSGRREGRPQLNALMTQPETMKLIVCRSGNLTASRAAPGIC